MQEPANMPVVVLCHDDARKQVSIVYQFQSICFSVSGHSFSFARELVSYGMRSITDILQALSPPISIDIAAVVVGDDALAVVVVEDMSMVIDMVIEDISIL